jgi:hypothetical protein
MTATYIAAVLVSASVAANAIVAFVWWAWRRNPQAFLDSAIRGAGLHDYAILVTSDSQVLVSRDWSYGEDVALVHDLRPLVPMAGGFLHRLNQPRDPPHGSDDSTDR